MTQDERNQLFYSIIRCVPHGRVATYGQIASLAGLPKHARHVGVALRKLPAGARVPWHRIVSSRGEIARRAANSGRDCESEQYGLLLDEGIEFDDNDRICLERYQWKPRGEVRVRG